jgi:hypothetical protein
MKGLICHTHQLFGVHVVEDAVCILAVPTALHDGQQQFGRVVLELQHEVHARLAKWVDVIKDQCRDDVQAVGFVNCDAVLVVMARTLTVLRECLQRLVDQRHIVFVDVQPQQPKTTSCGATDTVHKHQGFRYQIVVGLVVLVTK